MNDESQILKPGKPRFCRFLRLAGREQPWYSMSFSRGRGPGLTSFLPFLSKRKITSNCINLALAPPPPPDRFLFGNYRLRRVSRSSEPGKYRF